MFFYIQYISYICVCVCVYSVYVLGVNPSQWLNTTQLLTHSLPVG